MQPVRVYTSRICVFCNQAKQLLTQQKIAFEEISLDQNQDLRMRLSQENGGWRTVPMIFIGDEFVGGFQELYQLHQQGELMGKVSST